MVPIPPVSRPHPIAKYLENFGSVGHSSIDNISGQWDAVVVLPAYNEKAEDLARTFSLVDSTPILCVLVVNCPTLAPSSTISEANALLRDLGAMKVDIAGDDPTALVTHSGLFKAKIEETTFLIVDRFTPSQRFPCGGGVGVARKLGGDIALHAIATGRVKHPWIFSTDADAILPADYLEATHLKGTENSAVVFPYRHVGPSDDESSPSAISKPLCLYEISLRYYRRSLERSIPRVAHDALGSAISISAPHYAQIRGFPKRSGGEDFYAIAKSAKVGKVGFARTSPIQIVERESYRVPFGTAPGTRKIAEALEQGKDFTLYNPRIFLCLSAIENAMQEFAKSKDRDLFEFGSHSQLKKAASDAVKALQIEKILVAIETSTRTTADAQKRMEDWFDDFRVLKAVHFLRDSYFPNVPWREALITAEFITDREASEQKIAEELFEQCYPWLVTST